MHFHSVMLKANLGLFIFTMLVKFSFTCENEVNHLYNTSVVSFLKVKVRSHARASILVDNRNYAPQSEGYNVVVLDPLSGRFLTSAAFDCATHQAECNKLGVFLKGLPKDVVVLLAAQGPSVVAGHVLPTTELKKIGANHAENVSAQTRHAVIGYKGQMKGVTWIKEILSDKGSAEVSSSIPIRFSYKPKDSTCCTPFNVASQKYGGSCLNQSPSWGALEICQHVIDRNISVGWNSSFKNESIDSVNSSITIGFHSIFVINKLRIRQNATTNQQIQEILLEFSDSTMEKITLTENRSDFEEFFFTSRKASWAKFTITKVNGTSGGAWIQEIELYDDKCDHKTFCDTIQLLNHSRSIHYRLQSNQLALLIEAEADVSVLLTSDSQDTDYQYKIKIGSNGSITLSSKTNECEQRIELNFTLLKDNETRPFWLDIQTDRLVFGSGEQIYLFWREAKLIKIKYAVFNTTTSPASFRICPIMGVIKRLNITVRSEARHTVGRNLPNGLAFIWVNNENYAPQNEGYNVVVFDALSGRFLTSNAFNCFTSQDECDKLGVFLKGLPSDAIVLLAVQDSAVDSYKLPTSDLIGIGAQKANRVVGQTSHAVIGYKGPRSVTWIKENYKESGGEPAVVSSSIPISFLYLPEDSTTCTPFNVASQKYGGSCLNQSSSNGASNGCEKVLDESTAIGWKSSTNESVNSFFEIGFHSTFIINKLRIMQMTTPGRRIQNILLEFSDHSVENISLKENSFDFEEFVFSFRKVDWVRFTIIDVYNGSGGVGIQEIEFYNGMCKQKTICDAIQLLSHSQSVPYRLHSTQFPLMINSRDNVSVSLTSTSRVDSHGYKIEIVANGEVILKSNDDEIKQVMKSNVTLLKENETRLFWVEIQAERLVFGSGDKIYLFWRDAKPIKIKYAFFSTTSSTAMIQVCARIDYCYKDASHYWPLDKSTFYQQDLKGDKSLPGKIHGRWILHYVPANLSFTPLALSLSGSHSWIDLGSKKENEESCLFSPLHCQNGISVSFKANLSANGIGYILSSGGQSSGGFSIYHVDDVMHFNLRDGQRIWQVQGSYEKNAWHAFAMSWSQGDGLTAVISGESTSVLRDTAGRIFMPKQASHSSLRIGRSMDIDGGVHADVVLRDVAIWEEAIAEERMSTLLGCNDLESCNPGWLYFDGSCYNMTVEKLYFTETPDSCRKEGGELVKISSEEENNFVKYMANSEKTWIGLREVADGNFRWTDGSGLSFSKLTNPSDSNKCVTSYYGNWAITYCNSQVHKSICEQIPWNYLGCYEDSTILPRFVFNPGDYRVSRMTPGLCMHLCDNFNFTYAGLRDDNICLCSNSTANVTERPRDLCLSACLGAGNLKCGGGSYLSVYKAVQVQHLTLNLSADSSAVALTAFNLKIKILPSLSKDQIVESYVLFVGDGVDFLNYNETKSEATLIFSDPGNYTIKGRAIVKHTKTGHRSAVESFMITPAVSNVTDIAFICPTAYPVNFTFSCSLQFSQGTNVNATIEFEGGYYSSGFVPDAMVMNAGIPVSDPGGQVTSDGLYLLPTMDVTNKGKVVAFEMDVDRGGFLEIKVYRPKCLDSKQRYCRVQRMCDSSVGCWDGNKTFSFAGTQCVKEDGAFSENKTTSQANFDYENISNCTIQTTRGHKVILVESCTQQLEVEEGDVIAVQFPSSKPGAAIKTSLSSISLFYNTSLSGGTEILRSNRHPVTASSPTELRHAPAIAILYTALSGRSVDHLYQTPGNKSVSLTLNNSYGKFNFTAQIFVQEPIKGLELSSPNTFALLEPVNITTDKTSGTDLTYYWEFSDGEKSITFSPFVTHNFTSIGEVDIFVFATNDVSLAAFRCSVDVQERIEGLKFRNNSLLPVENGTLVSIDWLLRKGSHVNFNFSITSKESGYKFNKYFDNAKTVNTILFSVYKTKFSIPDLYLITIIAANRVNNLTLTGNLSVEQNLTSIEMKFPPLVKTKHEFKFVMSPHQGDRTATYTLNITGEMDSIFKKINTYQKNISYVYQKAGNYSVVLSAVNDISSLIQGYSNMIVQEEIKRFSFNDPAGDVIIQNMFERVNISWSLIQGTDVEIVIDYGDGYNESWVIPNPISYTNTTTYDYKETGKYTISFKAKNLVSEKSLNKTVYVDPYELDISCVQCGKEGNRYVVNPSSKITFKGHGETKGGKSIKFDWKVKNCSADGNDCSVAMDLKGYNSTPLNWKYFVIRPDKLQGGVIYKIILFGEVEGGKKRSKEVTVRANTPPSKGNCTVTPTEGQALETLFNLTCNGFSDTDKPIYYEFLYSKSPRDLNQSLGSGPDPWQNNVILSSGDNITIYAKVSDSVGATTIVTFTSAVNVKTLPVSYADMTKKAEGLLNSTKGDMRRTTSIALTTAEVLNERSTSTQSDESEEEKKVELREKLVEYVESSVRATLNTSVSDVRQIAGTLTVVTSKPEQNTNIMLEKLSDLYDNASKTIFEIAIHKSAPSEKLKEASAAVLNGAVNLIRTVNFTRGGEKLPFEDSNTTEKNTTERVIGTLDRLSQALVISMVDGEEPTTIDNEVLSMGLSLEGAEFIGKKPYKVGDSEVKIPEGSIELGDEILNQVSILSAIKLFPEGNDSGRLNDSKFVRFSLFEVNTADNSRKAEHEVKNLTTGNEISVIIPLTRTQLNRSLYWAERKLVLSQYSAYSFEIKDNISTVTFEVTTEAPFDVEIFVTIGREPNTSQHLFNFSANFLAENYLLQNKVANLSNSTLQSYSHRLLLADDVVNFTVAGRYFAKIIFKKPSNLTWLSDEIFTEKMHYNISVYRSWCMFFDEGNNSLSTEGVKVGPKTNLTHVECLATHLTTFGSDFFVPPNRLDFNEFSLHELFQSPHALIAVCTILGLYFLCLTVVIRADKNDALKAGVTPLLDNDSRDTYCYQIQVHTGFIRGAGTSAEVSIVLTGALGDSEPRLLKDPKRKTFKTGAVDAFLLIVPQSLGNLKQIRVWHNNGGTFPSWNLLRIMIQDIQTDQRWWFVCDNWLAVEEGDGKIERTLIPASKKELTKFNVLFASEVRKNLTDGHIWFSVVARPPLSTFTRVQRLTCCLSILLCTMLANAMFYEVGKNETTKNAIKIMGFSFSIQSVSIGIISSLVVFPVNLVIATIFRKARPKESRYEVKTGADDTDDVDVEEDGEKKNAPASKGLPHWFVYVAYGLAFLSVTTSGTFVIMYGMQFGAEKSVEWLSSMAVSFLQDVLLTQPIKVFILATLFALLIKDPKKAEDDSYADINALAKDEEWLHTDITDLAPEIQKTMKMIISDRPPEEAKLEIARQLRLKEKQMSSIIQEISWYIIFLLVLLTISYTNKDLDTSRVTQYMRNTFERASYSGNLTYDKVHEIKHYWRWLSETFIPSIKPKVHYDSSTHYQKGYLADIPTAFLLGVARLRQLRIKKDTCVYKRVSRDITECNDFYSIKEEDDGWYLPGWKATQTAGAQSQSLSSHRQASQLKDPWIYRSGEELKTFPYWGYKGTYSGGGYVQKFPQNQDVNKLRKIIRDLSSQNWLDRYTRAVFSEFAIYNANTNLFCVVTLLFEQLPTGSLSPYPNIVTLRLFRYVGGEKVFVITCEVVYFLFTLFFVVREVKLLLKKGKVHLKNPWSILEILVTLLSLSAVGLYFTRLKLTKDALRDMKNDRADFISFHYTAFLDEWLKCVMGVIVFLSFLKVFRLLRFNRRMSMLQQVLKRSFTKLMSFMVMFALAFVAYAFLACLVFGQEMKAFGTFLRSCTSLMDTLLGKFTLKELSTANRILGPIFFYTYTLTMLFSLLNIFISIINDAFAEVCSDVEKQSNDYEILDFMVHRLKEVFGRTDGHAVPPVYKERKSKLETNLDKIADNADNATHFMRNIAFEDMRVTRWFQLENCTRKKKNLMRLLMEVDWDYHEDELCDSIPVFERFLEKYSEEELERILQHYHQKRMVEDIVFDKLNATGEFDDSSDDSNSASDDSNDNNSGIVSNDEKMFDDEMPLEDEDSCREESRITRPTLNASLYSTESRQQSGLGTKFETIGTRSPSPSIVDSETATLLAGLATVMSGKELIKALKDAQREVEDRWVGDPVLATSFEKPLSCDDISSLTFDC